MFKNGSDDFDFTFATYPQESWLYVRNVNGNSTEQLQVYDKNGPIAEAKSFPLEEIEMQWICMTSRGRPGRPDHPKYDPSKAEWSECNTATDNRVIPFIVVNNLVLLAILNA